MNIKQQWIMFYTILRREVIRMFRIFTQVFLPPVITTGLYFMIFGSIIGNRIGSIEGISYAQFIAPGLVMLSIITNAYGNVSNSLFSARFQRSVEEMLISPMSNGILLLGYVLGGTLRGLIVAFLVYLVSYFFVELHFYHWMLSFVIILSVSALFSLAGFTNAMLARSFDDVMLIPTFILAPLSYLGGVFYSAAMLPEPWQQLSKLNPIYYMVHALRNTMLFATIEPGFFKSLAIIFGMIFLLVLLNLRMLQRGVGLRE